MNSIINFISAIFSTLFNMTTPCEITNEFFWMCGHTVTTRKCHNDVHRAAHLPEDACDATCQTRVLPTVVHAHMLCLWCSVHPIIPVTTAVRSDPGVNNIPYDERVRRRALHTDEYNRRVSAAGRARFRRIATRRAQWEAYKTAAHGAQDSWVMSFRERTFYMGEGIDTRLMRPVPLAEIPEGPEGNCLICTESLREGLAIVLPCHEEHKLHSDCFQRWFFEADGTNTCPYCREPFNLYLTYEQWLESFNGFDYIFSDDNDGGDGWEAG